ncbi:MAG: low-specificity L-threonine aldolase [Kangiellaceae bacterium]|jgi:threonine aldolase
MNTSHWIDLRSDTVTQPSEAMRKAMSIAEVGDDVYGDDPTVNRLQQLAAEFSGQESALFVSSGVQSNLIGLLCHCQRGDEYIVGQQAHTYKYEGGGAAVLGSIQPQPIEFSEDGSLDLDKVASVIKEKDVHFARTRLLCLENTTFGKVVPQSYIEQAIEFSHQKSLSIHLDGARICNAAVSQNRSVKEIAENFDSVSICLSKGLGAPIGSVLCGPKEFIEEAKHWRKMLGGGMRQAGIIAAAGLYALTHNVERLAEDHENAKALASGLSSIDELQVTQVNTNILWLEVQPQDVTTLADYLADNGVNASFGEKMRLVTHLGISRQDVKKVIDIFKQFYDNR